MNSTQETIERRGVKPQIFGLGIAHLTSVIFAFGCLMSLGWLDNARGPIYPFIIEDLMLSHSQGSAFFAVASLTAVLANFSVPFLLKIMSSKTLLFFGALTLALFPVLMSYTVSYFALLFSAVTFGWSLGIVAVTQNLVIEESVPLHRKRFFLSMLHSTYGLSALLAPILIGFILSVGISWQNSLLYSLFFIVPVLIVGLISANLVPEKVKNNQKVPDLSQQFKTNFNKKILLFWGVTLAFYVSSELFFTTRIVVLLKETQLISHDKANLSLALFFLGLFLGRLLISFTPSKVSGRFMLNLSFCSTALWILICYFFDPQLIWLSGFFMAPVFPLAMDEISNQVGSKFASYSSIIIAISSTGVVFMHMLVGYIFDTHGMLVALFLPCILCVLCSLICITAWPVTDNASKKHDG